MPADFFNRFLLSFIFLVLGKAILHTPAMNSLPSICCIGATISLMIFISFFLGYSLESGVQSLTGLDLCVVAYGCIVDDQMI